MKEQIISFEIAKLAKEKGFDIFTGKAWIKKDEQELFFTPEYTGITNGIDYNVPTQYLLQRWLREKHNIHITIWYNELTEKYRIDTPENLDEVEYNTYEEALEAGLQGALKLIKDE